MEVELTELYDLEVERHDGVATPASGFSFLVTKSAAPAATEPEGDPVPTEFPTAPAAKAEETPQTSEVPPVADATKDAPVTPGLTAESVQEIVKAALAERDSAAEERVTKAEAEVAALKSALDVLKATPIPGGPVISPTVEQRAVKARSEAMKQATYHKRMAEMTSNDRELSAYHVAKAKAFEAEAK